jgi:hypothetical protein
MQHIKLTKVFVSVTGVCILYPHVVLYVIEAAPEVVAQMFATLKSASHASVLHFRAQSR